MDPVKEAMFGPSFKASWMLSRRHGMQLAEQPRLGGSAGGRVDGEACFCHLASLSERNSVWSQVQSGPGCDL